MIRQLTKGINAQVNFTRRTRSKENVMHDNLFSCEVFASSERDIRSEEKERENVSLSRDSRTLSCEQSDALH